MNSTAQDSTRKSNSKILNANNTVSPVGFHKEREGVGKATIEIQPVSSEVSIPKEVEQAGVEKQIEVVEIPPDMKKMGLSHAGISTPLPATSGGAIVLPLTDSQITEGLHMQIYTAIRWLSEWCIRQLKRAHQNIKIVHGNIIRVKSK